MATLHSFLQTLFQFVKVLVGNVSKKMHRSAAVLTVGCTEISVVAFNSTSFGGGGKNALTAYAQIHPGDTDEEEEPEEEPAPDEEDYATPYEQTPETEEADDEEEMDIDEFAQYACQYAGEIDCSISGKSMLALYERIEIMEEDGIPLTKTNAEDLIEEAADRADRPSLGKRMKGLFSSKYDKEGRLILKEEHFI